MNPRRESAAARIRRDLAGAERARRRGSRIALASGAFALVVAIGVGVAVAASASDGAGPATRTVAAASPLAPAAGPAEPVAAASSTASPSPTVATPAPHTAAPAVQRVRISISGAGYSPSRPRVTAKAPIALTVGRGEGCAAGFSIPALGIEADNTNGPVTLELGMLKPGVYDFTCGMGMVGGSLVVE